MTKPEPEIVAAGSTFIVSRAAYTHSHPFTNEKLIEPEIKCQLCPTTKYRIVDAVNGELYRKEGKVIFDDLNEVLKIYGLISHFHEVGGRFFLETIQGYEAKKL